MNHRIKSCCQPKEDAIQVLERMRMHNKTLLMLFDDSMQDIKHDNIPIPGWGCSAWALWLWCSSWLVGNTVKVKHQGAWVLDDINGHMSWLQWPITVVNQKSDFSLDGWNYTSIVRMSWKQHLASEAKVAHFPNRICACGWGCGCQQQDLFELLCTPP